MFIVASKNVDLDDVIRTAYIGGHINGKNLS